MSSEKNEGDHHNQPGKCKVAASLLCNSLLYAASDALLVEQQEQ